MKQIVASALDVPIDDVHRHSSLINDLGAESIDFIDIVFRLESDFRIEIPEQDIWRGSFEGTDEAAHRRRRRAAQAADAGVRLASSSGHGDAHRSAGAHHRADDRRLHAHTRGWIRPRHERSTGRHHRDRSGVGRRLRRRGRVEAARRRAIRGSTRSRGSTRRRSRHRLPPRSTRTICRSCRNSTGPARGRIDRFAGCAAAVALKDSCLLSSSADRGRIGVAIAAGMGRYDHREVFAACAAAAARGADRSTGRLLAAELLREMLPDATARRTPGSIPARSPRATVSGGPAIGVMTACAGGTQAIGDAMRWIRRGRADAVVAGGADSELYPMGLASFCLLGALSTRNDDPARGQPSLRRRTRRLRHGRRARACWCSKSASTRGGAARGSTPRPPGSARRAMPTAPPIRIPTAPARRWPCAARSPTRGSIRRRIDYINAHGTSTPANDRAETLAIKQRVWRARRRDPDQLDQVDDRPRDGGGRRHRGDRRRA